MLAAPIGRLVTRISGIIGSFCRLPRAPVWSAGCSLISSLAFVASVPGKSRQSLAFSRWPGRLEHRRKLAAPIGRLVTRISGIIGSFCRLPRAPVWSAGCSLISSLAFVASVPGKSRQSLAFSRCPGRLEHRRKLAAPTCRRRLLPTDSCIVSLSLLPPQLS